MDEIEQMNEREKFFTDGVEQLSMFDHELKMAHRILHNGSMASEQFILKTPELMTVQWDANEYEVRTLTQGELTLKKRWGD